MEGEDRLMAQVIENGNCAAVPGHPQPWRFVLFSEGGLKYLSELHSEAYRQYAGDDYEADVFWRLQDYPLRSTHVILLATRDGVSETLTESALNEALACVVQNMCFTVAAYGLSSYWSTTGAGHLEASGQYLYLEPGDTLAGLLYIGWIDKRLQRERKERYDMEGINWIRRMPGWMGKP